MEPKLFRPRSWKDPSLLGYVIATPIIAFFIMLFTAYSLGGTPERRLINFTLGICIISAVFIPIIIFLGKRSYHKNSISVSKEKIIFNPSKWEFKLNEISAIDFERGITLGYGGAGGAPFLSFNITTKNGVKKEFLVNFWDINDVKEIFHYIKKVSPNLKLTISTDLNTLSEKIEKIN